MIHGRRPGGRGSCAREAIRATAPGRCEASTPPSSRAITVVEQALEAAVEHEDFAPFAELLRVLSRPYDDQEGFDSYASPPKEHERVLQTFCGT